MMLSWGKKKLIKRLNEVEGIERYRISSIEPNLLTEEMIDWITSGTKFLPHYHIPLQSGCDTILKAMGRRYDTRAFADKIRYIRKKSEIQGGPKVFFGIDVIVGFPGETEEEFEKSKAFVDKVNFYETHIFKYSKRQGTKAAVMDNQVPEQIKTVRSNIMLEMDEKKRVEYEKDFVGKEVEVLFEEKITKNEEHYWVGHTKEYVKIALQTEENLQNQLAIVRIDKQSQIIR